MVIIIDSILIALFLALFIFIVMSVWLKSRKKRFIIAFSVGLISFIVLTWIHYSYVEGQRVQSNKITVNNNYEILNSDIGLYLREIEDPKVLNWISITKFSFDSIFFLGYFEAGPYDSASSEFKIINLRTGEKKSFSTRSEFEEYYKTNSIDASLKLKSFQEYQQKLSLWITNPLVYWFIIFFFLSSIILLFFKRYIVTKRDIGK